MNRLAGDDADHGTGPCPDLNALSDQHLRIPAADRVKPQESLVVNVLDEQPDLVAVTGEHDPGRTVGIDDGSHIAMPVGADFRGKSLGVTANHVLHRPLVTRRAGSLQKLFEKLKLWFEHPRESFNGRVGKAEVAMDDIPLKRVFAERIDARSLAWRDDDHAAQTGEKREISFDYQDTPR